jgi:hypothetical protein
LVLIVVIFSFEIGAFGRNQMAVSSSSSVGGGRKEIRNKKGAARQK